jgi:multidrug efflux pump subunit AcrB
LVLALTSKTISTSAIYHVSDTVIAQRISQVPGVGDVTVSGADQRQSGFRSIQSHCRMRESPRTT